jgi:hypothetical protein
MKKPETYMDACMTLGQGIALVAITVPLEGIGGPFMLSKYEMPAASTSVRSGAIEAETPFIFRGDGRAPAEIFETGFKSKGNNMNLFEHADTNPANSGFVSTSTEAKSAIDAAKTNQGYVYKIENNPGLNGVDVNKTLGTKSPYPHESEIAIPYKIPNTNIKGAQAVTPSGEYTGSYYPNPNYTPNNTTPKK